MYYVMMQLITQRKQVAEANHSSCVCLSIFKIIMSSIYGKMTLPHLRKELQQRQIKSSGRKAELVARLEALDSLIDTRLPQDPLPPAPPLQSICWPEAASFRSLVEDIRPHLPEITKSHVEEYILFRQQNDKEANSDLSALKQGALLAKDKVQGLSYCTSDNKIFFSGLVEAQMKKVSYAIKFILNDKGEIQFSCCECAAGVGPTATCKHVAASLLTVLAFKEEGSLSITLSCTESLQSFHRPSKRHCSSPVKAENLGKGVSNRDWDLSDPRPEKWKQYAKEGYQDHVNMLTVNYCNATRRDSNWRFKFGKADIQTASEDHFYDKLPVTHY
jgi:hypothetical protein